MQVLICFTGISLPNPGLDAGKKPEDTEHFVVDDLSEGDECHVTRKAVIFREF